MKLCGRCNIEKDVSNFRKRSAVSHGLQAWCKECYAEYDRERYATSESERNRKKRNRKNTSARTKDYVYEYLLSHPCVDCGENDPVVLEFDHMKPGNKYRNVSDLLQFGLPSIEKEIEKCEVRCANCHRRKTAKQFGTWKIKK